MASAPKKKIFRSDQITMPASLPPTLLQYSMEMIRANPPDLIKFSRKYFEDRLRDEGYFEDHQTEVFARMEAFFEINRDKSIREEYTILEQIDVRSCYQWRRAVHKQSGIERGVKIVSKANIRSYNEFMMYLERLRAVDHPALLKIFEIFEDRWNFYFVTELFTGGDLFQVVIQRGFFNEKDAAHVIKQLLAGVSYLHSIGITHRDLKAPMILMQDSKNLNIKIADYEMSLLKMQEHDLTQLVGSSFYQAPEVLKGEATPLSDEWAIGVLLFIMLSGAPPFEGRTEIDVYRKISQGRVEFGSKIWNWISGEAKELIRGLMTYNWRDRLAASEAVTHPWFQKIEREGGAKQLNLESALYNLQSFDAGSKLKQALLAFFSQNLLDQKELNELASQFSQIDKNGNGSLSKEELMAAFKQHRGDNFDEQEVDTLIKMADSDGSGEINYSEWIMTAVDRSKLISNEKLESAFKMFDKDGSKTISYEEIKGLLDAAKVIEEDAVKRAMKSVDSHRRGELTFNEFKQLLQALFESA